MEAREAQQLAADILRDLAAFSERATGPGWPDGLWPAVEGEEFGFAGRPGQPTCPSSSGR